MRDVMIIGTGMTPFGRFLDRSLRQLAQGATAEALSDCGLDAADIDMVFFGNAAAGLLNAQECVRGQVALRGTELMGKPIINVENACASSSTAFHLAWLAVASGQSEAALALGAEKMYNEDRLVPLRALEAAADAAELAAIKRNLGVPEDAPSGSIFMDLYASVAKRYMQRSGATAADFAAVSVKSRRAGALNERAQFRAPVSVDEVLESRMISDPLTLMMCSPIGDGAAGLVLASAELARQKGLVGVTVKATAMASGRPGDETAAPTAKRAADAAYETAGLGPEDLDLVELHDAAAPAELTLYEELGLAEPGGGAELLRSGRTALDGALPVNTGGGLLSRGHPVGATGCAQLVELTDQLRGRAGKRQVEGAKIGLAENAGGWLGSDAAASVVTILAA
jgi:acetyl-CoA acetyltransferase